MNADDCDRVDERFAPPPQTALAESTVQPRVARRSTSCHLLASPQSGTIRATEGALEMSDDQHALAESGIEDLASEREDLDSSPARYEVVTYPADFTLEGLVQKYRRKQITIPGFQRKFVWSLRQATRLIESFLLGLPVPAVFLFVDSDDKTFIVIDGQQRLRSIVCFFDGTFGSEELGNRTVFALRGLHEKSPYRDKTYSDLQETDPASFNTLNDAVLRAFVVRQLNPNDTTSAYHIFERLNTGGTHLVSQEIRNCIYRGPFNDLLGNLNGDPSWRRLFGKANEDKRQRDVELVLRFLALREDSGLYKKPMKDFLSAFMDRHRDDGPDVRDAFRVLFRRTMTTILETLGEKPFHIKAGLNAAVFDSVSTAYSKHLDSIPADVGDRYRALVADLEFLDMTSTGTTDEEILSGRLQRAETLLFM